MAHVVGPKGQVVIAKGIRDRLGVEPGWVALQRLVDDHVEVYFLPPEHRKSLKGSLARYLGGTLPGVEDWAEAKERAWTAAAQNQAGKRS